MCRNIKTLFNFAPPATELEIRDASLQFVRKLSGFAVPSQANEAAFERAVAEIAVSARTLIGSLVTVGNRVRVRVGPLAGEITTGSAERLGLREGDVVVASFKATAARLIPLA